MKIVLTTLNAKYIHTNLALRWLYVAKDSDSDVVIHEFTIRDDLDRCADIIAKENPDVIGISIYIWNSEETKTWILKLKERCPEVRIILGGPEVTYDSTHWLSLPIECILRGEGERTFWQVVHGEVDVDGYLSTATQSTVAVAKTDIQWLETLPKPYFLEMDKITQANRYHYIETSRGCPYQCSYCLSSLENQVRLFSEEYVLDVFNQLEKQTCKQVKFLDRTFNIYPQRAYTFAKKIQEMDVQYSFQVEVVADTLSEELLTFFKTYPERFRFEIGVQSFNEKTLQAVSRNQNLPRLVSVIKELNQAGNHLHVDLIAGLPFEDYASFKESFLQLFACFSDEIQIGILKLLPGTKLRTHASEMNLVYDECAPYTVQETPWITAKELQNIGYLYQATEKLYNSSRLRQSLNYLFQEGVDIFELFVQCGKKMSEFIGQIQIKDMFLMVFESLKNKTNLSEKELEALLSVDYYRLFKQKPTRLFDNQPLQEQRKMVFKSLMDQALFSEQELNQYGKLEWGFHAGNLQLLLILYSSKQELPRQFWIQEQGDEQYGIMDCIKE